MFQNFDAPSAPVIGDQRLNLLRQVMADHGVTMVLVPHNDEQNNEYLPEDKERLAWLTGFTGSAGTALVTADRAILFVGGRYTLQAAEQADPNHWTIESLIEMPPHKWFQQNATSGDRLGFDPWLHTASQVKQLKKAAGLAGAALVELASNPIDAIWHDQPPTPLEPTRIHDHAYAGRLTRDKLQDMQAKLEENRADLCILTDPASVCWLFNIRGSDVAHTPISLSHAILRYGEEPLLFIDQRKLDMETKAFLTQVASMQAPAELAETVEQLAPGKNCMLDGTISPYALNALIEAAGGTVIEA
ncbi:MAG: aminopeptidase P family N-terminal domain-containing protein, partial [Rhizobiaceae bacterium]